MIHFIIVSYSELPQIKTLLDFIVEQKKGDWVIHVADNKGVTALEEYCKASNIDYHSFLNIGYGSAVNSVLKSLEIKADDLFFISNDDVTIHEKDSLHHMVDGFRRLKGTNNNIGPVVPQYINHDKSVDQRFTEIQKNITDWYSEIYFSPAAFWLVDGHFLRNVGGFFPSFFMYGEDRELSYRWNSLGYQSYLLNRIMVEHTFNYPPKTITQQLELEHNNLVAFYLKPGNDKSRAFIFVLKSILSAIVRFDFSRVNILFKIYSRFLKNNQTWKKEKQQLNQKQEFRFISA